MKNLTVLFATLLMLGTVGVAKAQKIASMDYESVLAAMPEAKKMSTDLEAFSKAKGDELNKQATAFEAEVKQYQTVDGPKMTEAQRQAKEAELQKKQQGLQQLQYTAQTDLSTKREAALKPIIDKINASVEKVAKAGGYEFVLDAGSLIYRGGADLTPAVRKDLGL